ncbi:hypothetical protein GDO81_023042 [Engystomops pustulosus]|uniref:WAP domain-containing protein n=1 Tax=Engystomops pustulosus TaxID=76066 RepID=A0AAV6YNM7_ENGPU|nr:hypothetical protein GDO81_023042 [Engystomops pustulosus]
MGYNKHCENDFDCPKRLKCCNICGKSCVQPVPEPNGICPKVDVQLLSELQCPSVYCSRDSDCAVTMKCCATGGKQKCMKIEIMKRRSSILVRVYYWLSTRTERQDECDEFPVASQLVCLFQHCRLCQPEEPLEL